MVDIEGVPDEEREFQKVVAQIGGKERIYLVGDVCESNEADGVDAGLFQGFVRDMFPNGIGEAQRGGSLTRSSDVEPGAEEGAAKSNEIPLTETGLGSKPGDGEKRQKTATRTPNVYSSKRVIDAAAIVFLLRQSFFGNSSSGLCVREILSDVKARTKRASVTRPALIGLVRSAQDSAEARHCAQVLEAHLRSVFHKHAPETIWAGCYIPSTELSVRSVKKNFCRAVNASQTAEYSGENGSLPLWPFQCWFSHQRRESRSQPNKNSSNCRQKGEDGSAEEGLPLKPCVSSAEPQVNGSVANCF